MMRFKDFIQEESNFKKGRPPHPMTPDVIRVIKQYHAGGYHPSADEVAAAVHDVHKPLKENPSARTVARIALNHGLQLGPKVARFEKLTPEIESEIKDLNSQGHSSYHINLMYMRKVKSGEMSLKDVPSLQSINRYVSSFNKQKAKNSTDELDSLDGNPSITTYADSRKFLTPERIKQISARVKTLSSN